VAFPELAQSEVYLSCGLLVPAVGSFTPSFLDESHVAVLATESVVQLESIRPPKCSP